MFSGAGFPHAVSALLRPLPLQRLLPLGLPEGPDDGVEAAEGGEDGVHGAALQGQAPCAQHTDGGLGFLHLEDTRFQCDSRQFLTGTPSELPTGSNIVPMADGIGRPDQSARLISDW